LDQLLLNDDNNKESLEEKEARKRRWEAQNAWKKRLQRNTSDVMAPMTMEEYGKQTLESQ
jgi:hypothetical protein